MPFKSEGGNINSILFSYAIAFGDRPHNFEPWSSDEDNTPELAPPLLTTTPHQQEFPCRNCGGGDRGRVAIYRPFGEFRRAKSYCHLYGPVYMDEKYRDESALYPFTRRPGKIPGRNAGTFFIPSFD
ncbi:hypothetical protein TNCV_3128411 [Trichonephila clavipes]|nr:hypothetical protein TNCV_3128411 [Trichonephila clavipes]